MKGLNGDTTRDGIRVLCYGAAALVAGIALRLAVGPDPGAFEPDRQDFWRDLSGILMFGGVCCAVFGLVTIGRAQR